MFFYMKSINNVEKISVLFVMRLVMPICLLWYNFFKGQYNVTDTMIQGSGERPVTTKSNTQIV